MSFRRQVGRDSGDRPTSPTSRIYTYPLSVFALFLRHLTRKFAELYLYSYRDVNYPYPYLCVHLIIIYPA